MVTLLLGATGLLGQAMAAELSARGSAFITAARSGASIDLDISDREALKAALEGLKPDLVVNCAAMADIPACEANPERAWAVNAHAVAVLADWSKRMGGRLLQVSTDHYFVEGGSRPHSEDEEVQLLNLYARTKFAAEGHARTSPHALVLRTSIVGVRGWTKPTFAEWAIASAVDNEPITLFADAYTSAIDTRAFAKAALDLVHRGTSGLLNCAASQIYTKEAFVRAIAEELGRTLHHATIGSATVLDPPRPTSLGLDVSRAEAILGYKLPGLAQVVEAVLDQHSERQSA